MDGKALVYCEGVFGTPIGKTGNGLVRFTARYEIAGVLDSSLRGRDAGEVLDGKPNGIPIFGSLDEASAAMPEVKPFFIIGLAPDGGKLPVAARAEVLNAIERGMPIVSGLHQFLSEDPEFSALAERNGVVIRDVRRPPDRSQLHFFTGKIEQVKALKIAVLGTDSAIGKRTTAVKLAQALNDAGIRTEMIGTGQTSWLQGVKYGILLDSLINDFVTGEIEHAIYEAYINEGPEVILIEGQGSIAHPAYPGGFELIAAGRVDGVILQHAPNRKVYDGFEAYPMGSLDREIRIIELLAGKPVIALTLNHEGMTEEDIRRTVIIYESKYERPAVDVLLEGCDKLVEVIRKLRVQA